MPELQTIALWGLSSSGKTAFLAQLYLQPSSEWEVYPGPESQSFLDLVQPHLERNQFPLKTAIKSIEKVDYTVRQRTTGKEMHLVVEDRAGEEYLIRELTDEGKKRLNDARGLVLLFDPESNQRGLEQNVEKTLTRLNWYSGRGSRKDERPIAICLSKSDLFIQSPEDLQRAIDRPRDFVLEKISPHLLSWVDKFCSNYELFPVSSVGVRLRYGAIEPVVFRDETLKLRLGSGGDPVNLLQPLAWLMERIKGVTQ